MHITPDRAHALNVVGAWAVALAEAIHLATCTTTGVSGAGPAALVAIGADPGMSIDELRRALGLTHPGAVRLVDRLVQRGLLQRWPGHGRTVHLHLTTRGHARHDTLLAAREDALVAATAGLSSDTMEQVARLVAPALGVASTDTDRLRHLCRLCSRSDCEPCPVARGLHTRESRG